MKKLASICLYGLLLGAASCAGGGAEREPTADSKEQAGNSKLKCLTVCDRWKKDCRISVNATSGAGGPRQCRRYCAKYGKDCRVVR
ncbi:MAG: hypothetical protein ACYYK0_01740 [Candidatus Eutrophobiaceae bacterium]